MFTLINEQRGQGGQIMETFWTTRFMAEHVSIKATSLDMKLIAAGLFHIWTNKCTDVRDLCTRSVSETEPYGALQSIASL